MPLPVSTIPPPSTPPPSTPPPPATAPLPVDTEAPTAQWISPTGTVLELTKPHPAEQMFTTPGPSGWGAVPVELITDAHPRGGATVRHVYDEPQDIHWPLHIYGDTYPQFQAKWREVVRAFTETKRYGPGLLRVRQPDGTARQISAFYAQGLEGRPGENWLYANPVVTFHCPDPYWQSTQPVTLGWSHQTPVDFYSPYMSISASRVLGAAVVNNPGDTTGWPDWALTGPATSFQATNNTTGQSFLLTHTLSAGEQATITTRRPRVRGDSGENLTGSLSWPGAVLWGLARGVNNIDLQVGGAAAGTRVDMSFTPRYESH